MNPVVEIAKVASTDPKEISSENYQPISDPKNVKRFVQDYFRDIPVLQKIAFCESTYRHLNKDGSVKRGRINSYDLGVMQINELYHAKEANALGIDLESIDGNVAFARHLYAREGSQPWSSSGKCWNSDLAINLPAQSGESTKKVD